MATPIVRSSVIRSLDQGLYVRRPGGLAGVMRRLDRQLYGRRADQAEVLLPYEIFQHWVLWVRERQRQNMDTVIAVTGRKGKGKSTLAFQLARALDPKFTLQQVVYRAADMADLFVSLRVKQAAVYDEAALGLLSTDWATTEAKALVAMVTILRPKRLTMILCLPKFRRLNSSFREDLVDLWVKINRRGYAVVHPAEEAERYTERHGIGWFPDPEWNPLQWDSLQGDPEWKLFERRRWAQSEQFLRTKAFLIGAKLPGGSSPTEVGSARVFPCEICGKTFRRREHLKRHLGTKEHQEAAAGGAAQESVSGKAPPAEFQGGAGASVGSSPEEDAAG